MYPHKKSEKETKKSEKESNSSANIKPDLVILNKQVLGDTEVPQIEIARYYDGKKDKEVVKDDKVMCDDNSACFIYSRPQLGILPSFIPFE